MIHGNYKDKLNYISFHFPDKSTTLEMLSNNYEYIEYANESILSNIEVTGPHEMVMYDEELKNTIYLKETKYLN